MTDDDLTDKSGAPDCGIYIRIDLPHGKMGEADGDYSAIMLDTQLIMKTVNEESMHEKNMHVIEISGGHPESLKIICEVIRSKGFVVIIKGDHVLAQKSGADGVMLGQGADIAKIRKTVGEDFIIGVPQTLHDDADYVALAPIPQEITAFCARTDKLCLVSGKITKAAVPLLAEAGATFVDMSDYIFGHKDGVVRATEKVIHVMKNAENTLENLN